MNKIYFLTERSLLLNAVSQQYIFIIRIDLIISDMIFTRSSVTFKTLALKFNKILYIKVIIQQKHFTGNKLIDDQ